jgi:hypothetical protein
MGDSNGTPGEGDARGVGLGRRQPCCPVCNGVLVPLRDQYRCSRCFFTLCVGCEPEEMPDHHAQVMD